MVNFNNAKTSATFAPIEDFLYPFYFIFLSIFNTQIFTITILQKGVATHSSISAWRIPWTEEPGRLQSMGSQRVGHD